MLIKGKIVGTENFSYKDKKTGEQKNALRYHFQYDDKAHINGIGCGTVFSPFNSRARAVGDAVLVVYANKAYMMVDTD